MSLILNGDGSITGAATLATTVVSPTLTTPVITSTLGVGGATPSASGAGITFPATQSASSDANTLDDYEEGTWSPVLVSSGGGSVSLGSTSRYVKIGRAVMVTVENFSINTTGLSSGDLTITGFPFPESGSVSPAVAYIQIAGTTTASVGNALIYLSSSSTATIYKAESTSGPGINPVTKADVLSSISLRFNGYYLTTT